MLSWKLANSTHHSFIFLPWGGGYFASTKQVFATKSVLLRPQCTHVGWACQNREKQYFTSNLPSQGFTFKQKPGVIFCTLNYMEQETVQLTSSRLESNFTKTVLNNCSIDWNSQCGTISVHQAACQKAETYLSCLQRYFSDTLMSLF